MDKIEITEQDIFNLLDSICYKLDGNLATVCKNSITVWDKLKVIEFIVSNNTGRHDRTKEKEVLEKEVHRMRTELAIAKNHLLKLEEENKTLKDENCKQLLEIHEQSSLIKEQCQNIQKLQQEVAKHTAPKTMKGNKNAYKSNIDSVQVFMDVDSGMSISKAAEKYHVSRETIRKRCKEGKHLLKR